jgi:hypothetical protein
MIEKLPPAILVRISATGKNITRKCGIDKINPLSRQIEGPLKTLHNTKNANPKDRTLQTYSVSEGTSVSALASGFSSCLAFDADF